MPTLSSYRKRVDALVGKLAHAKERVREERVTLAEAEANLNNCATAQSIVQQVAQEVQQQTHDRIASVVSRCMGAIFGPTAYKFRIHFERKRGKTEARLVFVQRGHEIHPKSGSAGGCRDIAAFGLRVACLMMSKPEPRRVLIFDEPFKNVSKEYREAITNMVEKLASDMGIQFIFITHIEGLEIGKVIEL